MLIPDFTPLCHAIVLPGASLAPGASASPDLSRDLPTSAPTAFVIDEVGLARLLFQPER